MRTALRTLLVSQLLVAATGCSPIAYKQITESDHKGLTKFSLQSSAIVIDEVKKDSTTSIVVTSVPTESRAAANAKTPFRYGLKGTDYFFWKTTHLNVEKYPNTSLIKSLTIDTEDNRKEFITSALSVAGSLVALGFAPPSGPYPFIGDVESLLITPNEKTFNSQFQSQLNGSNVLVEFGPISPDAIPLNKFDFNSESDVYAFSACRTAKVTYNDGSDQKVASVLVADPNFIQTIKVPEKGSITMHSACGVDTKSEKSSVNSNTEVLSHLVQEVKAALDAK